MTDETEKKWVYEETPPVRVSRGATMSVWIGGCSFLLVLLSFFLAFLGPLAAVPAIIALLAILVGCILSLSALSEIENSNGTIKGEGTAYFGFFLCGFFLYAAVVMPAMGRVEHIARRVVCQTMMRGIGIAFLVYTDDYDDQLPDEAWCDLLIEKVDVAPKSLICPSSKDNVGECSYALNKYVIGRPLSQLPASTVLLFETTLGMDEERNRSAGERETYGKYEIVREVIGPDTPVRLGRWNQVGGPEDLSVGNHEGEGANFVFADGRSSYEKIDGIKDLRWNPDDESIRWDESMIQESDLHRKEPVPVEVRRRQVRNLLAGAGVLSVVGFLFMRGGRMKQYAMVIAAAAAGMGAFWGMAAEMFYADYESTLPRIGWLTGLICGAAAAVGYCLIMAYNLKRGRTVPLVGGGFRIRSDVLSGMWIGLLCSLAVHGTLWMYHLDMHSGGIIHGVYWAASSPAPPPAGPS